MHRHSGEFHMTESTNPLAAFSDHAAQVVERAAGSVVAVYGGGRPSSGGIHWRSGILVTAEEGLGGDERIKVTLPAGRLVEATLAGPHSPPRSAQRLLHPDRLAG